MERDQFRAEEVTTSHHTSPSAWGWGGDSEREGMTGEEDSFIQQIFVNYVLYTKYYARHWDCSSKHNR